MSTDYKEQSRIILSNSRNEAKTVINNLKAISDDVSIAIIKSQKESINYL